MAKIIICSQKITILLNCISTDTFDGTNFIVRSEIRIFDNFRGKKFPWMGKVGYKRIQLTAEKKKHYLILQSD